MHLLRGGQVQLQRGQHNKCRVFELRGGYVQLGRCGILLKLRRRQIQCCHRRIQLHWWLPRGDLQRHAGRHFHFHVRQLPCGKLQRRWRAFLHQLCCGHVQRRSERHQRGHLRVLRS